MPINSQKTKFYLSIGLIMTIIIIAWIINLDKTLNTSQSAKESNKESIYKPSLKQNWQQITNDVNDLYKNIKDLNNSYQSPTDSAETIQQAVQLSPDELENLVQNIKVKASTTTTTTNHPHLSE